jgi:hypothetical protein
MTNKDIEEIKQLLKEILKQLIEAAQTQKSGGKIENKQVLEVVVRT